MAALPSLESPRGIVCGEGCTTEGREVPECDKDFVLHVFVLLV